ncbi:MAG: hypothetical protein Q9M43_11565 [Sulfurimonas sp.]|nr:hypothetical protein [Sulfurimonas sp.]
MNITTKQQLIFINLFSLFVIFIFASVIAKDSYKEYNTYHEIAQTSTSSIESSKNIEVKKQAEKKSF